MGTVRHGGGVVEIAGSVGGTVFARSKGGATMRARIKGIRSGSPALLARRAALSNLSGYWGTTLEPEERLAWEAYASQTNQVNRLGQPMKISGMAAFIQTNSYRLLCGLAILDAAPITGGKAPTLDCDIEVHATLEEVTIESSPVGWVGTAVGALIVVRISPPTPPGRMAANNRLIYVGCVKGASSAETFPLEFDLPTPTAVGLNTTIEIVHVSVDGKVSARAVKVVAATNPT